VLAGETPASTAVAVCCYDDFLVVRYGVFLSYAISDLECLVRDVLGGRFADQFLGRLCLSRQPNVVGIIRDFFTHLDHGLHAREFATVWIVA
jgi:hypothetical protein